MVLVIGSVRIQEGSVADALRLSLAHVRRSRAEPGCVSHAVHRDAEDVQRLVFVEEWSDQAALQQHFKLPDSRGFAAALSAVAAEAPRMAIYEARHVGP
jgi:quinol monooxygenase YgiN